MCAVDYELSAAKPAFWKHSLQQDSSKWKLNKPNKTPKALVKTNTFSWVREYHKKSWPHNFLPKLVNS